MNEAMKSTTPANCKRLEERATAAERRRHTILPRSRGSRKTYHVPATVNTNCEFSDLITLSVNVVLKLTNSELLIANYAFDEIAN